MPAESADIAELERRNESRRLSDRHWLMTGLGVLGIIASAGVAFGTSSATTTSMVSHKVDREEWLQREGSQDARINANSDKIDGESGDIKKVLIALDSTNLRLRQIWCDGKPASCR